MLTRSWSTLTLQRELQLNQALEAAFGNHLGEDEGRDAEGEEALLAAEEASQEDAKKQRNKPVTDWRTLYKGSIWEDQVMRRDFTFDAMP